MSTTPEPETRCPQCRGTRFSIEWLLVARPDGSYSLAGATRKVSADQHADLGLRRLRRHGQGQAQCLIPRTRGPRTATGST
jgi:hypothetical protein